MVTIILTKFAEHLFHVGIKCLTFVALRRDDAGSLFFMATELYPLTSVLYNVTLIVLLRMRCALASWRGLFPLKIE